MNVHIRRCVRVDGRGRDVRKGRLSASVRKWMGGRMSTISSERADSSGVRKDRIPGPAVGYGRWL